MQKEKNKNFLFVFTCQCQIEDSVYFKHNDSKATKYSAIISAVFPTHLEPGITFQV